MNASRCIVVLLTAALLLVGCISAERKAEYKAWQASAERVQYAKEGAAERERQEKEALLQ